MELKANKKSCVAMNTVFIWGYQVLLQVVPLVLAPYLTRVLGDTALGRVTYVTSIAYYFVIASNLGISRYGQRVIAKSNRDIPAIQKTFWSLFTLHVAFSLVVFLAYCLGVVFAVTESRTIYWIEGLYVLSAMLDVTWLYYGLERFREVTVKNGVVRILRCVLIFLLVRSPKDLWIYALLTAGAFLAVSLVLLIPACRAFRPVPFSRGEVRAHLKPLLVLSFSVVAATLYTVFDKTLLGWLCSMESVAYYEYANRIILLPIVFISGVSTAMFPRSCRLTEDGDTEAQRKYLKYTLLVMSFIGCAALFGLLAVARELAVVYYGEAFAVSGNVMMAFCALPLIIGIGEILRTQYLLPNNHDRAFVISLMISAAINLVLSILLIPVLGIYGAVIGSMAAELCGLSLQLYLSRGYVSPGFILRQVFPFALIGLVMYVSLRCIAGSLETGILSLLVQVGCGAVIYIGLTAVYLAVFQKEICKAVLNRLSGFLGRKRANG